MAKDDDPPAIDVDAIQAQIDLAMSMTEELVASWVKPSAPGSKPSLAQHKQSFEETERELQMYMNRPPRCELPYSMIQPCLKITFCMPGWVSVHLYPIPADQPLERP